MRIDINEEARLFEILDNGVGFDVGSYERFTALGAKGDYDKNKNSVRTHTVDYEGFATLKFGGSRDRICIT